MKIVVLAGGISTERDVSFVSGKNVYEALKSKGHQVVLTDVYLGMEEMPENVFEADVDWTKQIGAVTEKCPAISPADMRPPLRSSRISRRMGSDSAFMVF